MVNLLPVYVIDDDVCDTGVALQDAGFVFAYDEPLSHMIYAAADILLVPSMFEPCGLTQVGLLCMCARQYSSTAVQLLSTRACSTARSWT